MKLLKKKNKKIIIKKVVERRPTQTDTQTYAEFFPRQSASSPRKSAIMAEKKPIGEITHFYGGIGVAIIKFNRAVKVGETVHFKGAHTDFTQTIGSMQFDHKEIQSAKKGQEVGIKVDNKMREGDEVFEA